MNFRPQRVGKLIREELSGIMIRELEFPDALVTITEVVVDKKLEHAAVRISVIPPQASDAALKIAKKATGRLQHLLLKRVNIKPMPRIEFRIDHGPEDAASIEKLFIGT